MKGWPDCGTAGWRELRGVAAACGQPLPLTNINSKLYPLPNAESPSSPSKPGAQYSSGAEVRVRRAGVSPSPPTSRHPINNGISGKISEVGKLSQIIIQAGGRSAAAGRVCRLLCQTFLSLSQLCSRPEYWAYSSVFMYSA